MKAQPIDRYDAMNDPIDEANRQAKLVAAALKVAGVPVKAVTEADYEVDASVEINDTHQIQVSIYGSFALNWWENEETMCMNPPVGTIAEVVAQAQEALRDSTNPTVEKRVR